MSQNLLAERLLGRIRVLVAANARLRRENEKLRRALAAKGRGRQIRADGIRPDVGGR